VRAFTKSTLERAIVISGAAGFLTRRPRYAGLVLSYHDIVPAGDPPGGDLSLHLPQRQFAAQLDLLQRHAEVVPLPDLLDKRPLGPRPRVAITFDDAYRGAITAGVAELRARGLPATVFVAPGFLDGRSFWWDALATDGGLAFDVREHALTVCAGRDSAVRAWAPEAGLPLGEPPAYAKAGTEAELRRALDYPGLLLGSHTWAHPNLPMLPDASLAEELSQPLAWLQQRFGPRVGPWLAYPYGLADRRVERAAEAAGYAAAFRVQGGWLPRSIGPRFALPRLNVPAGLSNDGFLVRLAGLFCR
jgi:peptidoglycan/xylan/chitin deacetylase (PgdA/CDA1 family)